MVAETSATIGNGKARILIIEDDPETVAGISEYLATKEFDAIPVSRGDQAVEAIQAHRPDLVILDLMLPGMSGIEICRFVRGQGNRVPIIMLTARDEDFDEVLGLEIGADDYIVKPVRPRVLLARITAQLRRFSPLAAGGQDTLTFGNLVISKVNREVTYKGHAVSISSAEFDLLSYLASNAGRVVNRDQILQELRGLTNTRSDRSIDARMYRLRSRFMDIPGAESRIKTVRPHGYLFSTEPW
ncbi:MAG: response regulator transcription factor [Burkholderiales bacterium]|nr:response regulator transcription factor [Burkholderiales bacterium]